MRLVRVIVGAVVGLAGSAALAYDVNKDLQNIGPRPAFDIAVVLAGSETVTGHYDGYGNRHFGAFSSGPSGANTLLHWQNLVEPGGNGQIDPGEIVHVGWTTADHSSQVLDMYWTDQQGQRIPGSKIFNITTSWTYETSGFVALGWGNIFTTEWGEMDPIQIMNVSVAVAPAPWPLDQLNAQNVELNQMMQPLPDGNFVVEPGQDVLLTLPFPVPPGQAVVLRYGVYGPGDEALAMDWVQFVTPQPPPPTNYFINKDLQNVGGQPAFDIAIVLAGSQTITAHYDGYGNRHFGSFSSGPSGPNTLLHWQNLSEPGGNGQIDPGEIVHVGWGTTGQPSQVLDMYWTDQQGQRIPGSKIFNITSQWTYETSQFIVLSWPNVFQTEWGEVDPIQIINASIALSPTPWPLDQLNAQNVQLNEMMQPLPAGDFVVEPGQEVLLRTPFPIPPNMAVVIRYGVYGPGDQAIAMDWVQFITPTPTVGACCLDITCDPDMTVDECQANGGTWYDGQTCGDFVCPGESIRCTPGDIDGDGAINNFDITPFVRVLVGQDSDPDHICSADVNGDGRVDNFDITPFVALVVNGLTNPVGYAHACDGQTYTWSINAPVGQCYLVTAGKGGTNSDCPVFVAALDNTNKRIGGALVLQPGGQAEFCVPAGATHLVYRCDRTPEHVCRFSWQLERGATNPVSYSNPCNGTVYTWSVNAPVGRCYLVEAGSGGTASDCPVIVDARDNKENVIGGAATLPPGTAIEFCVPPGGASHLTYRCESNPNHTCRFSWNVE